MEKVKCEMVGMLDNNGYEKMHDISRRVYSGDGVAPTLHTCGGGNLEPKIIEQIALDEQNGYLRKDGTVGTLTTDGSSPKHNNRIVEVIVAGNYSPSGHSAATVVDADGAAPTVMENHGTVTAIIEPRTAAMRGRNTENPSDRRKGIPTEQRLEIGGEVANTLTTVQKDSLVVEPCPEYIGCAVHPLSKKLEFDGYKDTPCPTLLATDYKCPKTVAFAVPPQDGADEPIIYDGFNQRVRAEKGTVGAITRNVGADLKRNGQGVIEPIAQVDIDGDSLCVDNVNLRVRKLTERECFRLMGVTDADFKKVQNNQSKSSLYHLAGDSIVTACLMAIFGEMLDVDYAEKIKKLTSGLGNK